MELVPRCGVQGRGENLSEPEPDEAGAADPAEAGEPALPERHAEELDAVTPDALARLFEHPEARVYAGFPGRVAVTRVWAWCLDPSGRLLLSLDRGWAAAPAGLRVFYACDDPAWTQFSVVE
jgi:hypothetical protein